jgi:DNA-directed RNA polymerase specialized sigma24 family protein
MGSPQQPFDAHALYALVASLPERQKIACALWYVGERAGPLSELEIADRMGIKHPSVHKLIAKGTARLTAAGFQPKRATRTRAA